MSVNTETTQRDLQILPRNNTLSGYRCTSPGTGESAVSCNESKDSASWSGRCVDMRGTNCRRIGSTRGLLQSATLRICGVSRTAIGAAFIPASTSAMKSSRVLMLSRLLAMPGGCGIRSGSTPARNLMSLSFLSIVLATCTPFINDLLFCSEQDDPPATCSSGSLPRARLAICQYAASRERSYGDVGELIRLMEVSLGGSRGE